MTGAAPGSSGRRWRVLEGALLGTFAAFLLMDLGVTDLLRFDRGAQSAFVALLLGGATLGFHGRARIALVVDALLLLAVALIAYLPWTSLMDRWVRHDALPAAPVDAIVVLSGGMASDSTLFGPATDRLLTGLELYRQGRAPRIVTTRVVDRVGGVRITSDRDQRRLVELAGAASGWMMVDSVGVTHDEAVVSADSLFRANAREVIVVTSPAHTRRACATFEHVGFAVWCRATVERTLPSWHGSRPSERLSVFRDLLYELAGMVKYRMNGWI